MGEKKSAASFPQSYNDKQVLPQANVQSLCAKRKLSSLSPLVWGKKKTLICSGTEAALRKVLVGERRLHIILYVDDVKLVIVGKEEKVLLFRY